MFGQAILNDNLPGAKQHHWSPYTDNGGTIVAVAGDDFAIIASDTRLIQGYSILTREQPKLFKLSEQTVLGVSGCWCDVLTFTRTLEARMKMYLHEHLKPMSTPAVAQLVSTMLYHKRFFPYYVSNIVAGLDQDGKGTLYSYDPVGHCEKNRYRAGGAAGAMLQPLLDNQVGLKNMKGGVLPDITKEKALMVIKDSFISAAERDTSTGDGVIINIITKSGVEVMHFPLRKD
ncbi:proteasome subunit beta type-1-like [Daphnia carinata]|uniref:proteasome subunit beta type-1-like n=1 Tax=Daphnia carinata TaxID=120202 RepID=UPI00257EA28A|nr:proteasome subunit beta type-1-like [Daphnia carinata]